jgi:hypothetical protein
MMIANQPRGESTLKTTFVAISDTVKAAREVLTSSLFHWASSHLTTDKQIFSYFRHNITVFERWSCSQGNNVT